MTLRRWYVPGAPETADGSPAPQGRDLEGARLIIVGDVLHSRVARSNVDLMTALGAKVTLVAPPTLLPVGMDDWPCEVSYNLDEAIEEIQPDAVMMLRIQRERMSAAGGASSRALPSTPASTASPPPVAGPCRSTRSSCTPAP